MDCTRNLQTPKAPIEHHKLFEMQNNAILAIEKNSTGISSVLTGENSVGVCSIAKRTKNSLTEQMNEASDNLWIFAFDEIEKFIGNLCQFSVSARQKTTKKSRKGNLDYLIKLQSTLNASFKVRAHYFLSTAINPDKIMYCRLREIQHNEQYRTG